jgi:hypothetical protein
MQTSSRGSPCEYVEIFPKIARTLLTFIVAVADDADGVEAAPADN